MVVEYEQPPHPFCGQVDSNNYRNAIIDTCMRLATNGKAQTSMVKSDWYICKSVLLIIVMQHW